MTDSESVFAGGETTEVIGDRTQDLLSATDGVLRVEGKVHHATEQRPDNETLTIWHFQPDKQPSVVEPAELRELVDNDSSFVWVDLTTYTRSDMERVATDLELHRRVVPIALSSWQRPRVEVFGNHFVVTTTIPVRDDGGSTIEARELDLVVGNNYLLSVHKLPLPFAEALLSRARQDPDLVRLDSAYMLYIILDEQLEYLELLDGKLRVQVEHMQQRAFRDSGESYLDEVLQLKRYAFALQQLSDEHRIIFQSFLRPDFPYVSGDEIVEYFRELQTRHARQFDRLQAVQQEITGAFDIYVSHQAHRTNSIIKVLTMVSATLLPVTVIISIFGTSFRNVSFIYSLQGFVVMLAAIVLVIVGSLLAFRRLGWI